MKGSPYRAGPWPGLTPSGAAMVLACAGFLAVGQVLIGPIVKPLPDLAVLGVTTLVPLALAERIVRVPGAATAACGAYLLPRSLISLLAPTIPQPPLLLVPTIAFELALWLDASHLAVALDALLARLRVWSARPKRSTSSSGITFSRARSVVAGGVFGLVLSLVEPSYQIFLGGDPAIWTGPAVWVAALATTVICAALATILTVRGRAS
ncbi:MAG TPA: hypothetical protein VGK33_03750 [Chloroflexota bacterium]